VKVSFVILEFSWLELKMLVDQLPLSNV
jgi:hypothetical protein